ncbi:unnamed protein product [Oppiella nova]|uniref:CN hydrolase domain-containing protein n=1 Tax=Oppiella nova TaxID=334625 RepID=A0A7R9QJ97_9ACAR|nr:unnamed protein product [Oppiella nova]CAG2166453.1 unnamed protein product [Oppiella nova]
MADKSEFVSLEDSLQRNVSSREELKEVKRLLYGKELTELKIPSEALEISKKKSFEIKGYVFSAQSEQTRKPAQHKSYSNKTGVDVAISSSPYAMPFAFCTRERLPWIELAESAETGPTTTFLQEIARMNDMVIVSPILERDETHGDILWNTAVVISNSGQVLGKSRKNHIPRVGDFNENLLL